MASSSSGSGGSSSGGGARAPGNVPSSPCAMEEEPSSTGGHEEAILVRTEEGGLFHVRICRNEAFQGSEAPTLSMVPVSMPSSEEEMLAAENVEVDESPLKPVIGRNKESLKIKLQMRRPINQLVEQGILPSPNTPPAYACQRVKLERARMGDLLKAKIQQRPSRQELVRQHILEETDPRVAPLLAEKQRMLKRARLADSLNDHLIHRPGPLELVKKNILHAPDESIEKAIKEGIVPFKATSEGATPGPSLPTKYITGAEDDSSSDVSSPSVTIDSEGPVDTPPSTGVATPTSAISDTLVPESVLEVQNKSTPEAAEPKAAIVATKVPVTSSPQSTAIAPIPPPLPPPPYPFTTVSEVQSLPQGNVGIFAVPIFGNVTTTHQQQSFQQQPVFHQGSSPSIQSSSSSLKSRSKKISKSKSQVKPKTIKFHEYRGPPSAQKGTNSNANNIEPQRPAESSYELLLQQQQLFLQWQLEWQHRFPKILLPAVSKMSAEEKKAFCTTLQSTSGMSTTFPSLSSNSVSQQQHLANNAATAAALHPVVSSDVSSLPVQIISNPSTNSVLILSSAPTPTTTEPASNSNTNNTHHPGTGTTVTYVPQHQPQQQTTFVIHTPAAVTNVSPVTPVTTVTTLSTQASELKESQLETAKKLNDWKVNELKVELKKRNLPVSGSKSQLVERLQAAYLKAESNNNLQGDSERSVVGDASSAQGNTNTPISTNGSLASTMQQKQPELKFYIASNNSSPALLNHEAIQFLQKSGILKSNSTGDIKEVISSCSGGGDAPQKPQQPSSRSVLQQKIQQKLQARTQLQLANLKNIPAVKVQPTLTAVSVPSCEQASGNSNKPDTSSRTDQQVDLKPVHHTVTLQQQHHNHHEEPSWVLKITETNTNPSPASFENCLADLLSSSANHGGSTSQPSHDEHHSQHNNEQKLGGQSQQHHHVKSQMVDDVLEILIRNGELPASAAVVTSPPPQSQSQPPNFKPPPAPPLPPTTFAVTLPTEISFRRTIHHHPTNQEDHHQHHHERKGSLLGITSLTKEAEEILKISEELAKPPPSSSTSPFILQHGIKKEHNTGEELMDFVEEEKKPTSATDSSSIVIDDFLTEALEFPMDTEYSDWLESFSSDHHNPPSFITTAASSNIFSNQRMNFMENMKDDTTSGNSSGSTHNSNVNRGDPLLSSKSCSRLILDNSNTSHVLALDHINNSGIMMDVDNSSTITSSTMGGTETDDLLVRIRKDHHLPQETNVGNVNDLWDFSF